jgi:hypothetical protein
VRRDAPARSPKELDDMTNTTLDLRDIRPPAVWVRRSAGAGIIFARPDEPPSDYVDAIGRPAEGLDVTVAFALSWNTKRSTPSVSS